jgi:protein TonB
LPQPEVAINTPQPKVIVDLPKLDRSSLRQGIGVELIKASFAGVPESQSDADPFALTTIQPQYPQHAARNQIEGWVTIEFVVTETGQVSDAHVIASEPARIFDDAALKGVMKWTFKPAIKNGQPVSRRAVQTLSFRLDEG